jgi:hypothetical protein
LTTENFIQPFSILQGSITKYEGDGELDDAGDLKKVLSKTFNLDSSANWKLITEGTNIFNGDSTVYTAMQNGKEASSAPSLQKELYLMLMP